MSILWLFQYFAEWVSRWFSVRKAESDRVHEDLSFAKLVVPGGVFRLEWITEKGFQFVYVNRKVARMLNLCEDELLANSSLFFAAVSVENLSELRTKLFESAATFRKWSCEFQLIAANKIWLCVDAIPSRNARGNLEWLGIIKDISTELQIQAKLKAKRRMFELIGAHQPIGEYECDELGGAALWNDVLYRMIDVDPNEHKRDNHAWRHQVHRDDLTPFLADMAHSSQTNTKFERRIHIRRRDGTDRCVQVIGAPFADCVRKRPVLVGVVSDVTAIDNAQRLALRARRTVRSDVQATAMILAVLSHELRAPLHGITGLLDCLNGAGLNHDQRQILTDATASAQSLLVIINHILDYCKLEIGNVDLETLDFRPDVCLTAVIDLLRAEAGQRQLTIINNIHFSKFVRGDATRFCQALVHMLNLAMDRCIDCNLAVSMNEVFIIDGCKDSHVIVRVEVVVAGAESRTVHPVDQDPTFWLTMHYKRYLQDAIYRQLIRLFGGRAGRCNSSSYWFEVPFLACTRAPIDYRFELSRSVANLVAATSTEDVHRLNRIQENLEGTRVLLAEDSKINQRLIRQQLESEGCDVDSAFDGLQAVELATDNKYDIVLMDVHMPKLDGLCATREIRALGSFWERIPIIGLTADQVDGQEQMYRQSGMTCVLSKPLDKRLLLAEIHRWIAVSNII